MALALDQLDRLVEREVFRHRQDVGARHHHVIGGLVAQPQHIAEQDALMRVEAAGGDVEAAGDFVLVTNPVGICIEQAEARAGVTGHSEGA